MPENLQFQKSRLRIGQPSTPRKSIQAAGEVGTAIQAAGHKIKALVEKQQREHDLARVLGASTAMRDSARLKMSEVLKKEGADAAGVMKEYGHWFDKKRGLITNKLDNEGQKNAFSQLASTSREHDLDTLARHQAVEHKKHLKASLTATIATAEQDVVIDPFNEARMQESLLQIRENLQAVTPGLDVSAEVSRIEAGMKVLALQSLVRQDLPAAVGFLRKWKKDLGAAYPEMEKAVEFAVIQKERSFETEAKLRKAKKDEELEAAQEQWENDAFKVFRNKQLTFNHIMASPLDASGKERWINKLDKQAEALDKGGKDPFETEDPKIYAKWSERINLSPQTIKSKAEIWKDHGKGLSTDQAKKLSDMWAATVDPVRQGRKERYHGMLKALKGQYVFDGDIRQNELVYGRKASELDNFFIKKPDATDAEVDQFFKNLTAESKSGYIQGIIEFFKTMGAVEVPGVESPDQEPFIIQTGTTLDGRKVIKYSDGSVKYAD